jgi:hypothetical protein
VEDVHTFRSKFVLIGAEWSRADIVSAIQASTTRQLTGSTARSMKHGLVIDAGGPLFIATDEDKLTAMETGYDPIAMGA